MRLNFREFVAEKPFDFFAVRAPGLREDNHFVISNDVLHNIGND